MSVEEKAANEKAKYEIFSYYVHAGWQTGRDEQGFEVHIYENCSPKHFQLYSYSKYRRLWNPFSYGSVQKCSLLKRVLHLECIDPEGRHYQARSTT